MATSSGMKASPWVWVVAGLGAVAALANGLAIADAIFGAFVLGFPALLIDRAVQQRRSPQVDERPMPLKPTTVNVVEKSEVTETEPEVTKSSREEGGRSVGSGERMESVVDEVDGDPEVARLQEKLKAVEHEVEQRLDERRQVAEAELLEAEKARRIEELTQKLEQAEKTLSQVKDPDWSPDVVMPSSGPQIVVRLACRCGLAVFLPSDTCPSCAADMSIQAHAPKNYCCGECHRVLASPSVESCPKCSAVFQE
jgi:hypothetical protein